MSGPARLVIALGLLAASRSDAAGDAAQACPAARFLTPAAGEVVADARAPLAFAPQPGRTSVRVMVEIRAPEKEVLQRIDTEVAGDVVRLPSLASLYRADVKIVAYAKCGTDTAAPVQRRFHIDTGLTCMPPASVEHAAAVLRWSRAPAADRTEVAFLDAADLREIKRESTSDETLAVVRGDAIAVLRSRCGPAYSAPVFTAVGPATP